MPVEKRSDHISTPGSLKNMRNTSTPPPPIKVSAVGCALVDIIYAQASFSNSAFEKVASKSLGDGGLIPGALVFGEDFQQYTGQSLSTILPTITGSAHANSINVVLEKVPPRFT